MTQTPTQPKPPISREDHPPTRRRFTVDEYYQLADQGVIKDDERVELIDGEILHMSPSGPSHASVIESLTMILPAAAAGRHSVRIQSPLRLSEVSEPEPDVLVTHRREVSLDAPHPGPRDAALVIEVSLSSLAFDLGTKRDLYARHQIPEYWVIDIVGRVIHVFRQPEGDRFRDHHEYLGDEKVSPLVLPDVSITPSQLLHA